MRPEKFSCYPHVQWGYGPNGKMLCSSSAYDLQDQNAKAEDVWFYREKPINGILGCHVTTGKENR